MEVLVTDDSGTALSGELRLGTYYVKETKAPEGYLADTRVYPVTLGQEDEIEVYEVSSRGAGDPGKPGPGEVSG